MEIEQSEVDPDILIDAIRINAQHEDLMYRHRNVAGPLGRLVQKYYRKDRFVPHARYIDDSSSQLIKIKNDGWWMPDSTIGLPLVITDEAQTKEVKVYDLGSQTWMCYRLLCNSNIPFMAYAAYIQEQADNTPKPLEMQLGQFVYAIGQSLERYTSPAAQDLTESRLEGLVAAA